MTLNENIEAYIEARRRNLAPSSHHAYVVILRAFVDFVGDVSTETLTPPNGAATVDDFIAVHHPGAKPRTINKTIAILGGFFKWCVPRGKISASPIALVERARVEQAARSTFTEDERRRILDCVKPRDRVALRLLLDYGLRKAALQHVKLSDFDFDRRRVTITTKGSHVREIPLRREILADLFTTLGMIGTSTSERDVATDTHYLLHAERDPTRPISAHGLHRWWYARLVDAGIVPPGTTKGRKMHSARHTAAQRFLDRTGGDLKGAQQLLGHASISTTGDVYTGYSDTQLDDKLGVALGEEER